MAPIVLDQDNTVEIEQELLDQWFHLICCFHPIYGYIELREYDILPSYIII